MSGSWADSGPVSETATTWEYDVVVHGADNPCAKTLPSGILESRLRQNGRGISLFPPRPCQGPYPEVGHLARQRKCKLGNCRRWAPDNSPSPRQPYCQALVSGV